MYVVNNERNVNCELGYDRTLSIATMTFNGGNGAADDSLSNYKVIRVGDIAFEGHTNKVHAYGRFVLNDAGDGLMSPRFSCLRPIVEQRYSFWKYYIPREESMRPILVNATKNGTMMNELVPDDLMHESILVPCLAEQEVIGNSFSQLDHVITLHQRECGKPPFNQSPAWEQRKLGNCGTTYGGLTGKTKEDFGHGNARFIPYTNVFDNPLTDTKRLGAVEIDSSQNQLRMVTRSVLCHLKRRMKSECPLFGSLTRKMFTSTASVLVTGKIQHLTRITLPICSGQDRCVPISLCWLRESLGSTSPKTR